MSEEADNETTLFSTETDEEEDSSSNLPLARTRRGKVPLSELRQPRQKFSPRWETDFNWLRADKVDESVGVCLVCNKRLVCKKSHLERHQRSFKHQRLLGGFEILNSTEYSEEKLQLTEPEFLECGKCNIEGCDDDEYHDSIEIDPAYSADVDMKPEISEKMNRERSTNSGNPAYHQWYSFSNNSTGRLDRCKLLKRIDRERHALNEYYYSRRVECSPPTLSVPAPRDTFDLFFESVSASVKTFPPKLATEAKSRISQIIAEFELRAICEREAQEHDGTIAVTAPEIVMASTTHETVMDGSTVPQIVYTF